MTTLLNWDHEVNPTPFGDIEQNAIEELRKLGMHLTPDYEFVVYNGTKVAFFSTEGKIIYDRNVDGTTGAAESHMDKRETIVNEFNTYVK